MIYRHWQRNSAFPATAISRPLSARHTVGHLLYLSSQPACDTDSTPPSATEVDARFRVVDGPSCSALFSVATNYAALPAASAWGSDVSKGLPPIAQSPLSNSLMRTHVSDRIFSPST